MKYIDADKIKAEIDKITESLTKSCNPDPLGTTEECMAAAELEALGLVKSVIDQMQQEQPTPPGIENESQKKGWLDYGLTMGEIGLHRYNAIHRIKEHKEQFDPPYHPEPLSCRRILRVCWRGENLLLPTALLHGLPFRPRRCKRNHQ